MMDKNQFSGACEIVEKKLYDLLVEDFKEGKCPDKTPLIHMAALSTILSTLAVSLKDTVSREYFFQVLNDFYDNSLENEEEAMKTKQEDQKTPLNH